MITQCVLFARCSVNPKLQLLQITSQRCCEIIGIVKSMYLVGDITRTGGHQFCHIAQQNNCELVYLCTWLNFFDNCI